MRPRPEGRGEQGVGRLAQRVAGASMRPRPEGRGEHGNILPRRQIDDQLQCGHDPKAVENAAWWTNGSSVRGTLQCGHDPKAVENDPTILGLAPFWTRFNAATTRRPWRTSSLLYGGRCQNRSFNAATTRRPWRTAFWRQMVRCRGKSFNAATTRRPWRTVFRCGGVTVTRFASMRPQPEGRGELRLFGESKGADRGFNAATARRPWRTENWIMPVDVRLMRLQCGHSPKAVENLSWYCSHSQAMQGFNAATARRPWRTTRSPSIGRTWFVCFNAATARRPWRTFERGMRADEFN